MVQERDKTDVGRLIYKRVLRKDLGEFSLNSRMLNILMELDGEKSLQVISQRLGMSMAEIQGAMGKLGKLHVVERIKEPGAPVVPPHFFDYLNAQLSLAVGPIAEILVEDTVVDLGKQVSRFPVPLVAELVDLLARQIRRKEKGVAFRQNMVRKMKELGI